MGHEPPYDGGRGDERLARPVARPYRNPFRFLDRPEYLCLLGPEVRFEVLPNKRDRPTKALVYWNKG